MAASYVFSHLPLTYSSSNNNQTRVGYGSSRSRFLSLHSYHEFCSFTTGVKTWRRGGAAAATTASSSAVDETALQEVKVKIKVGLVRSLSERVYKFQKIFGPSSSIVVVTLPKPLGIVFVESPLRNAYGKNRIMVGELVVGGNADRASRVAQLFVSNSNVQSNRPIVNGGVMPGDILRATTTAGVVVDFFGIRRPQRVMDLYIADGRPWHLVMRALSASYVADGELTLVFERRNTKI